MSDFALGVAYGQMLQRAARFSVKHMADDYLTLADMCQQNGYNYAVEDGVTYFQRIVDDAPDPVRTADPITSHRGWLQFIALRPTAERVLARLFLENEGQWFLEEELAPLTGYASAGRRMRALRERGMVITSEQAGIKLRHRYLSSEQVWQP